ncbi:MAG: protein-ADP-ribose hydrolase, partial [Papillibacter sp.]|nr:protein-ADP-ribose hydrolase [Papillibacter sp.]
NLPSSYVLHTVGPIINGPLTQKDCDLLASCYSSCLRLADDNKLSSIAFCCISTGVFRFPQEKAAEIAVEIVREYLHHDTGIKQVVFNVFNTKDEMIYHALLD